MQVFTQTHMKYYTNEFRVLSHALPYAYSRAYNWRHGISGICLEATDMVQMNHNQSMSVNEIGLEGNIKVIRDTLN